MEAYYHQVILQACVTCVVNVTWVFALSDTGPECIPNVLAFSGTMLDHAYDKKGCKKLRFELAPVPNVTQEEFEEWLGVSMTTSTTTQLPPTTVALTDYQKCEDCVKRGKHFVKLSTGQTLCLYARDEISDGDNLPKASNPRMCKRIKWDEMTTLSPIFPVTAAPIVKLASAGFITAVTCATMLGLMMLGAIGYVSYMRKCRPRREDEESFGVSESVTTNWIFNYHRGQGVDETDVIEMRTM